MRDYIGAILVTLLILKTIVLKRLNGIHIFIPHLPSLVLFAYFFLNLSDRTEADSLFAFPGVLCQFLYSCIPGRQLELPSK